MKKRTAHTTIREYRIDRHGVRVGVPLHDFRSVLSGLPNFVGTTTALLETRSDG